MKRRDDPQREAQEKSESPLSAHLNATCMASAPQSIFGGFGDASDEPATIGAGGMTSPRQAAPSTPAASVAGAAVELTDTFQRAAQKAGVTDAVMEGFLVTMGATSGDRVDMVAFLPGDD